jgi:hypothetical protein
MLDDCGPKMTFDHANIYSGKGIKLGKERILHYVVLPLSAGAFQQGLQLLRADWELKARINSPLVGYAKRPPPGTSDPRQADNRL